MTVGEVRQQLGTGELTPFARTHSTLEHRPRRIAAVGVREPANDWGAAALDLFMHEAQRVASEDRSIGQDADVFATRVGNRPLPVVGHRELAAGADVPHTRI